YGAGSSRDWAAKGVNLLGVRAVLAQSFERIHRTNLIGMGVLPIKIEDKPLPQIEPEDVFEIETENVQPRKSLTVSILRSDETIRPLTCRMAVETELECRTIEAGGMIPLILSRFVP
ncbi:MAG: aconitate hydratase AcnA, partial [Mesorhizobium sp.]